MVAYYLIKYDIPIKHSNVFSRVEFFDFFQIICVKFRTYWKVAGTVHRTFFPWTIWK